MRDEPSGFSLSGGWLTSREDVARVENDAQNGEDERRPQGDVRNVKCPINTSNKTDHGRALQPHLDLAESIGLARFAEQGCEQPAKSKNHFNGSRHDDELEWEMPPAVGQENPNNHHLVGARVKPFAEFGLLAPPPGQSSIQRVQEHCKGDKQNAQEMAADPEQNRHEQSNGHASKRKVIGLDPERRSLHNRIQQPISPAEFPLLHHSLLGSGRREIVWTFICPIINKKLTQTKTERFFHSVF